MQVLRANSSILMESERFTFSLQEFSISSGSCASRQEAFDIVFKAMRDWALTVTPDVGALAGSRVEVVPVTYIRDAGTGAGASVLRRLLDKYGQITNRQLAEAIGLTGKNTVNQATFSNALAGKGSRSVRCVIATALDETPSTIWPTLPEKTRQADDDVYLSRLD